MIGSVIVSFDRSGRLPRLESEHLVLRPLTLEDVSFIYHHYTDPAVLRFLVNYAPIANLNEARQMVESYLNPSGKTFNRWGIHSLRDNILIGTCGFTGWRRSSYRAEFDYDLSPQYWGQGLMTEALQTLLHFGFFEMLLNRVEAAVAMNHTRCIHLLHKLGFYQEGVMRDYMFQDGVFL